MILWSKKRVFVALHDRQGGTDNPDRDSLVHSRFHWTIWTEEKGSKGIGSLYQVQQTYWYANVPNSGRWIYEHVRDVDCYNWPLRMVGRIMVGKMTKGATAIDLYTLLQTLPLPQKRSGPTVAVPGDSVEQPAPSEEQNSMTWIKLALELLKTKGWVEDVDIGVLMNYCAMIGGAWSDGIIPEDEVGKANYTSRKM